MREPTVMLISGGTIIDGVADAPIRNQSILVHDGRIKAIGGPDELPPPAGSTVVDARGKFVIAGLMNANVHLILDTRLEVLIRYENRYEDLILEAAQVALKNGVTTVFDTWGPRRALMLVRDRINANGCIGSRIFCGGNIVGFDGPISSDFWPWAVDVASGDLVDRINSLWVENTGPDLMMMSAEQVRHEIRAHLARGIDFVKFASNTHAGPALAFSETVQSVLVDEAHSAGVPAQAHTMTVEGLRMAVEAGCDLIQHCNITGPVPIPDALLELMAARRTGAVAFPFTKRRYECVIRNSTPHRRRYWASADVNCRNLIASGASVLLATDGGLFAANAVTDAHFKDAWCAPGADNLCDLAEGHFAWLAAMEEKGMAPMKMLRAATRNIARAYGKDKDLGTLERGKVADLLLLDEDPLAAAQNYRSIHAVIKDGSIVDRSALPLKPVLMKPTERLPEEAEWYGRYALKRFAAAP